MSCSSYHAAKPMSTILQKFSTHKVKFLCTSSPFGIYNFIGDMAQYYIAVQPECAFGLLYISCRMVILRCTPLCMASGKPVRVSPKAPIHTQRFWQKSGVLVSHGIKIPREILNFLFFVGFTMMCDARRGAMEMWKTAERFTHIPTALLQCLRRFSGLKEKKVANRDGLC